jgi:hypothetical protein
VTTLRNKNERATRVRFGNMIKRRLETGSHGVREAENAERCS